MSKFTVNYKDPASNAPKTSYIVDAGDADNSDVTQTAQGKFTVFYKDTDGDVVTSPTTVINGSGRDSARHPSSWLNGGSATGADKIKIRRDIEANWQSINPVLCHGELSFSTNTKQLKVGDGVSTWSELPNLLEVAPYEAALVGNSVTITEATHNHGTRPQIEVYAPSGDEVSVAVSNDAGTITICSSNDLTGHTVVIRA